jgi:hypothetical protein
MLFHFHGKFYHLLFEVEGDPTLGNIEDPNPPPPPAAEDQDGNGNSNEGQRNGTNDAWKVMGVMVLLVLILLVVFKLQVIMLKIMFNS